MASSKNLKKRKLDEWSDDSHEPNRKKVKRVRNGSNGHEEQTLKMQIEAFKEREKEYKGKLIKLTQARDSYKKEANKWKNNYMTLQSQIHQITAYNNSALNGTHSPTPPLSKCTYTAPKQEPKGYPNGNTNSNVLPITETVKYVKYEDISDHSTSESGSSYTSDVCKFEFGCKYCGREFEHKKELNKHIISHYSPQSPLKSKKKYWNSDSESDSVTFENSFHVSVNCHVCNGHFNDLPKYREHLKTHYDANSNKSWNVCDFCDKICPSVSQFIQHTATHTKDYPYKCDVIVDGQKCRQASASKSDLKKHWNTNHKSDNESSSDDSSQSEGEYSLSKAQTRTNSIKSGTNSENIDFEQSHYVDINCHVCHKHFDEITKYRKHLKKHYLSDPLRVWKRCDFGDCAKRCANSEQFIQHIASHRKMYPFKCKKCTYANANRRGLKDHWNRIHNIGTDAFEQNYIVSVHCHVCNVECDDMLQYKTHLKAHFESDTNKEWMLCDLGCNAHKSANPSLFVAHIAWHTKDKPFKCGVSKCDYSAVKKIDLRNHFYKTHSQHISKKGNIKKTKERRKQSTDISRIDFEQSFYVERNCHMCGETEFETARMYYAHLRAHYESDESKTWLRCDLGCKNRRFRDASKFACHIPTHTGDYPWKCKVMVYGIQCSQVCATKMDLKQHWDHIHNVNRQKAKKKKLKRKKKRKRKRKRQRVEYSDSSSSESDYGSVSDSSSYYGSSSSYSSH